MAYEVTIGIPVYNVEKYIRQTLDSALEQTFPNIEFLICDDCGTDSSISIVKEYQLQHPRGKDIRIVKQPKNGGVGAARNRIIDEAKGSFLFFMDSDDSIEPCTIELLVEHQRRTNADIVFGSYDKIETYNNNKVIESYQYPFVELNGEDQLAGYAYRTYGCFQASSCNFLISVTFLRSANLRFIEANYWEDMAFMFELVTYCRHAVLLPNITYHYMCRYNSLSNYQQRATIRKKEIQQNIATVEWIKGCCTKTKDRIFQPQRCNIVMMTDFYVLCNILKNKKKLDSPFTLAEMKSIMRHPMTLSEILKMKTLRIHNLVFYMLGVLPSFLSVMLVFCAGKYKKLI